MKQPTPSDFNVSHSDPGAAPASRQLHKRTTPVAEIAMRVVGVQIALLLAAATLLIPQPADAVGRSAKARAEFKRLQPCPANGLKRGTCPGWHIDHVIPLKCGGADAPANMQWLTVADHRAKTKREARLYRDRRSATTQ